MNDAESIAVASRFSIDLLINRRFCFRMLALVRHVSAIMAMPLALGAQSGIEIDAGAGGRTDTLFEYAEITVFEGMDLGDLLTMPKDQLENIDIGAMNVICAQGLYGGEDIDLFQCMETLDRWAQLAKSETERHLYKFKENPEEFNNSEAFFRMLALATVLQQDCGVKYAPGKAIAPLPASDLVKTEDFFKDSRDIFIHGLLSEERSGTCASLPVLLVAVGRRMDYPLYLVSSKSHAFTRWDDPETGERLNIEYHGKGMATYPDEYYRSWPYPLSQSEIEGGFFLKSLEPHEELAVFMLHRGLVLEQSERHREAQMAYARSSELMPEQPHYQSFIIRAVQRINPYALNQQSPFEGAHYAKLQRQNHKLVHIASVEIDQNYALQMQMMQMEQELKMLRDQMAANDPTHRRHPVPPSRFPVHSPRTPAMLEIERSNKRMLLMEYGKAPQ